MAGLIAWAADVVGGGGQSNDEDDANSIPIVFSPDQLSYVRELDGKAASLRRTIQDLRLRIPPSDISQRLPHLHAHSLASNADLALQLNSHSATRQQVLLNFHLGLWFSIPIPPHGSMLFLYPSNWGFFSLSFIFFSSVFAATLL